MSFDEEWVTILENPTLSVLPQDYVKPREAPYVKQDSVDVDLGRVGLAKKGMQELYIACVAVWITIVYRDTGDEDIILYVSENRVLRLRLNPNTSFFQLYTMVESQLTEILPPGPSSFDNVARLVQKQRGLDKSPQLFCLGCVKDEKDIVLEQSSYQRFDVLLNLNVKHKRLTVHYNSLLYLQERMKIIAEQITQLFEAVVSNPELALTKYNLLTPSSKPLLPDPTQNLDWSGFVGCIHDIFQDNASKFPLRTCVVETPIEENQEPRVFTYRDIDRASNIVAHYLLQTGIRIGDVVMIYSSRGVDLMICVMGVLKAGATFSVIDPAYPPARQNIYLGVAKPRGLIVIKSAGELDSIVEDYIKNELEVITRIPSIELQNDATITGGSNGTTKDVLAMFQRYQDTRTNVIVGPDSNPTLSFTSGSEGVPKGVLGRHFSLAYYFAWMSKQFHLSENDKFTMLSGIAHDPIQRDMFTPLFLGAQLYIPTETDIGTPGRLAAWMAKYGCTVTHLTPAMGQLLTAQADTPFPKLHHAFFVGDILTKRDCLRLQLLAKNVTIVNMYGTTETQRSVSYFEVKSHNESPTFLKSMKDIMPAGRGMLNVQLLVVNRNDKTQQCGVGEIGEIYVRAGGLAEGYRGLPDLTKEKFVNNWFVPDHCWDETDKDQGEPWRNYWLGPRDRLYRTGDLGRYLPNGDCECCGRADDQIKIRGFRIELGEIDTHISQYPLVRENVTLVRKNADGEPILITFLVPRFDVSNLREMEIELPNDVQDDEVVTGMIKYSPLVKELKSFLRDRLASYAIPSLIIVLKRLPLNPNGKIDKPKLQIPKPQQLDMVSRSIFSDIDDSKLTPTAKTVKDIWMNILPIKPSSIGSEDSFFDLGGHSILATKMIYAVQQELNVNVPLGLIFRFPSLGEFASKIDEFQNTRGVLIESSNSTVDYYNDALVLRSQLPEVYPSRDDFGSVEEMKTTTNINIFVTGVTGFLGSYILNNVLSRNSSHYHFKVYAHVRANDEKAAMARIKNAGVVYGTWDPSFEKNIQIVLGDLSQSHFGLSNDVWQLLANEIDVIIHNGALVHWVYPYAKLRDPNVISTINVMALAASGKPKFFNFVSSTSTLDTDYYFKLSDKLINSGQTGILEDDDLMGSKTGLVGGYGQSKWVAEFLIREAGTRGLKGCIVRPGYVTGASLNGSCNTDDFLLRFLKGTIQIGKIPDINNTVNMVPVDHVARVVVATALHPPSMRTMAVAHVTGHPRPTFKGYLSSLRGYGYDVSIVTYEEWKVALQKFISLKGEELALYPLLHMVLDNLDLNTRAPELDDRNAVHSLKKDMLWTGIDATPGKGVTDYQMGIYISFLIAVNFIPAPSREGDLRLPKLQISDEQIKLVVSGAGTRGSSAAT